MKWNDTGFLISKNRYSENSIIAEIFTLNYGKITGIIFGATSKRIKYIIMSLYWSRRPTGIAGASTAAPWHAGHTLPHFRYHSAPSNIVSAAAAHHHACPLDERAYSLILPLYHA